MSVILVALAAWALLDDGETGERRGPDVVAPSDDAGRGTIEVPDPVEREDERASAVPIDARRPTAAVTGRIVGAGGRPLGNAFTHLFLADDTLPMRPRPSAGLTATSGADGVFLIDDIPVDQPLGVEVNHADHAAHLQASFQASAGEVVDVGDITLKAGMILRGTIRTIERHPIPGAQVQLTDLTAMTLPGSDERGSRTAVCDGEGRYEFRNLAMRRQYRVQGAADGYGTQRTVISFVLALPDNSWTQDFSLRAADVDLGGWVLDEDSRPVPDVQLKIAQRHRGQNTYFEAETVTDDEGSFFFEALPRDTYTVSLSAENAYLSSKTELESGRTDHTLWVLPALAVRCRLLSARPLPDRFDLIIKPVGATGANVIPGAGLKRSYDDPDDFLVGGLLPGNYHFELRVPGFAVTSSPTVIIDASSRNVVLDIPLHDGGTVSGRVQGAGKGVAVELRGSHYDPKLPIEGVFPTHPVHGLTTRTDDDGRFALAHVPEESYTLTVAPKDAPPLHVRDVEVFEGGVTDLGVLSTEAGGAVGGIVLDEFGKPAPSVRVTLMSDEHYRRLITGDDGRFVARGLPAGRYAVTASPTTFEQALRLTATDKVEVTAGAESSVQLMFETHYPQGPRDG